MLETFIGVTLALGLRDIVQKTIDKYQEYKFDKDWQSMKDLAEDFEADDEDL